MGIEQKKGQAILVESGPLRHAGKGRRYVSGSSGMRRYGVAAGAPTQRQLLPVGDIRSHASLQLQADGYGDQRQNFQHRRPQFSGDYSDTRFHILA
jgi:hypothetical protein